MIGDSFLYVFKSGLMARTRPAVIPSALPVANSLPRSGRLARDTVKDQKQTLTAGQISGIA